jgi:hypothetical protein
MTARAPAQVVHHGEWRQSGIVVIPPPTQYPQAVWDELMRQGKLRRAGQRYMRCRTNREPPHSKAARP